MKGTRFIASALTLGTMMMASAAAAQNTTGGAGVQFGIGGGLAMPTGDFGEGSKSGFDVHGMLGFNPAALPFGVRVDAGYARFGFEGGGGNTSIISGTANALLKIPATSIAPYLIGGLGVFRGKTSIDDLGSGSSTEFGFQGGGGLQFNLSGMATHLEAKFVSVRGDGGSINYIPITFGIMFGGGMTSASRVR